MENFDVDKFLEEHYKPVTYGEIYEAKDYILNNIQSYLDNDQIKFELSPDHKIYLTVKLEIIDEFLNIFKDSFGGLSKERVFDYKDEDGWFTFDYIPLYDLEAEGDAMSIALSMIIEDINGPTIGGM